MPIVVRITGQRDLERKIARLQQLFKQANTTRILLDAGQVVADRAKELVPVRSGNLRDSIVVSDTIVPSARQGLSLDAGTARVFVGPQRDANPDGFYGHFVEFGTVNAAAHPFLRPAWEETKEQVQSIIGERFWDEIEDAVK